MNREGLEQAYNEGRLESPHRLRNLRSDIEEHTGLQVPYRLGEVRQWWRNNKSVFARKIGQEEETNDEEGDQ